MYFDFKQGICLKLCSTSSIERAYFWSRTFNWFRIYLISSSEDFRYMMCLQIFMIYLQIFMIYVAVWHWFWSSRWKSNYDLCGYNYQMPKWVIKWLNRKFHFISGQKWVLIIRRVSPRCKFCNLQLDFII